MCEVPSEEDGALEQEAGGMGGEAVVRTEGFIH
jgi:hypothetical protein